jgi:hypothetical protein
LSFTPVFVRARNWLIRLQRFRVRKRSGPGAMWQMNKLALQLVPRTFYF